MPSTRRQFLSTLAGTAAGGLALSSCASTPRRNAPRVVVVGGGYGGATCALYLRRFDADVEVLLIEAQRVYHTCPLSNAVIAGWLEQDYTRLGYGGIEKFGVRVIHDTVHAIDPARRNVRLTDGTALSYDRLVLSPGVSFRSHPAYSGDEAELAARMPHAWNGGAQATLLRRQLHAMEDGGLFVIVVPALPFRCPPGPYERAGLVAHYFQAAKPRSKVLILDSNEHYSKQDLFEEAWRDLYPGRIERISISAGGLVEDIDPRRMLIRAEAGVYKAAAASVIPFQRAGMLAVRHALTDDTGWCPVNHQTFESTRVPGVHVLGDSCLAGAMPKSATSANSQAKACSLAITALLRDRDPGAMLYHNTCYSLASPNYGISITGMYRYEDGRIKLVQRAGGTSPLGATAEYRAREAAYARDWFSAINADSFGL